MVTSIKPEVYFFNFWYFTNLGSSHLQASSIHGRVSHLNIQPVHVAILFSVLISLNCFQAAPCARLFKVAHLIWTDHAVHFSVVKINDFMAIILLHARLQLLFNYRNQDITDCDRLHLLSLFWTHCAAKRMAMTARLMVQRRIDNQDDAVQRRCDEGATLMQRWCKCDAWPVVCAA